LYLGTSVPVVRVPVNDKVLYRPPFSQGTTTINLGVKPGVKGTSTHMLIPIVLMYPIAVVHVWVTGAVYIVTQKVPGP